MTIWFTSDQHFGHKNIIHYCDRPFLDVQHMEDELVARHNDVVKDGDTVYHLGDFALDGRLVSRVLARERGEHHLICGNHDRCHPCHSGAARETRRYLMYGFKTVNRELHHMPYVPDDRHGVRYAEWRPEDRGEWLLHGHVHGEWKTRARMINVGVDVWGYRPVSLETLKAMRV